MGVRRGCQRRGHHSIESHFGLADFPLSAEIEFPTLARFGFNNDNGTVSAPDIFAATPARRDLHPRRRRWPLSIRYFTSLPSADRRNV